MFELNNREISTLFWFICLLGIPIYFHKSVRESFKKVLKAFFVPTILKYFSFAFIYIFICTYFLYYINIWEYDNLKTTIFWAVPIVLSTLFSIQKTLEEELYLKNTFNELITITIFIEFIIQSYTFNIFIELILVPIMAFLGLLYGVNQKKTKNIKIEKLLRGIFYILSLILIGYNLYMISQDYNNFFTSHSFREFCTPIILSFLFLPFLYILIIHKAYERIFNWLQDNIKNKYLCFYAKTKALFIFGTNIDLLERWKRNIGYINHNYKNIKMSFKEIQKIKNREKNPLIILPHQGWSPYIAKEFLAEDGLKTNDYHENFSGEEWYAYSQYYEIGKNILPDNITYYVRGNFDYVTQLELKLNVNNIDTSQESENNFLYFIDILFSKALNNKIDNYINLIMNYNTVRIDNKIISLNKNHYNQNMPERYSKTFVIKIANIDSK